MRSYIIAQSDATTQSCPQNARWLIDGMAAMRSIKPKATYRDWLVSLLKFTLPRDDRDPIRVEIVNDTYYKESVKSGTRDKRGEQGRRVHVQGFDQEMLKRNEWLSFFHNIENKTDLIRVAANFLRSQEAKKHICVPLLFTDKEETWKITRDSATMLFQCNHEDADTRLILHACLEDTNVVIVAKDTDVFILMVYAYCMERPKAKWYMKIDHDRFIDIEKVVKFLGDTVSKQLPAIHALTGCDTTSSFFGIGKVKLIKKLIKQNSSLSLLENFGLLQDLSERAIEDVIMFVQTTLYKGRADEGLIENRVRLYKALKTKSSEAIPPDPDSLRQATLRVYYQLYYWLRYNKKIIDDISFEDYGWTYDAEIEQVVPVWFTGTNFHIK